MKAAIQHVRHFLRSEEGPTTTEYAVMLAVICITALTAMGGFGGRMNDLYLAVSNSVADVF